MQGLCSLRGDGEASGTPKMDYFEQASKGLEAADSALRACLLLPEVME